MPTQILPQSMSASNVFLVLFRINQEPVLASNAKMASFKPSKKVLSAILVLVEVIVIPSTPVMVDISHVGLGPTMKRRDRQIRVHVSSAHLGHLASKSVLTRRTRVHNARQEHLMTDLDKHNANLAQWVRTSNATARLLVFHVMQESMLINRAW
jgi:hypothetical protein